jgi:hypothetical protein
MRRTVITATLTGALALSVPSLAQARHHNHHQHRRGHRHVHLVVFGPAGAFTPRPGSHGLADPSSNPTGSSAPSASGGETAGKVASFVNGVLTLTLNDETTVSGQVNEQTQIHCESAEPNANVSDDQGDGQDGEDQGDRQDGSKDGASNDQSGSSQSSSSPAGDEEQSGDDGHEAEPGEGHEQEDDEAQTGTCGISSLQPGVPVRAAELRIGPAGAVFTDVELLV